MFVCLVVCLFVCLFVCERHFDDICSFLLCSILYSWYSDFGICTALSTWVAAEAVEGELETETEPITIIPVMLVVTLLRSSMPAAGAACGALKQVVVVLV